MVSHDPTQAELSLLAVAVTNPEITTTVEVSEGDFYHPARGELWRAIREMHSIGQTPDPASVIAHLRLPAHRAKVIADLMVELATLPAFRGNVDGYAATVLDMSERRRALNLLETLKAKLEDETVPALDSLAEVEQKIARNVQTEVVVEDAMTLDEFCDQEFGPIDWVVPGLLARDDRLVITGVEGFGKSMLMRQFAVAVACGMHPFSLKPIPARKVLVVDCENPKRIMADKFGLIRSIANTRGLNAGDRLWIKRFPGGLDLADPVDRLNLHRLVQTFRPDLLVIGPVYKLYIGGSNAREEDLARTVTRELDQLREAFGFALMLEHHSPHGQDGHRSVRPIGSSLWLRWSEFGWGIAPQPDTAIVDRIADVKHWRGARDEREWPTRLSAGRPHELPWIDPDRLHTT